MPSEAPFSPDDFTSSVSAITSAFGDPTRRRVYLLAHEHEDGVTASEVAAALGLHANVARHHLDKLAAGGYVTVRTAKQTGAAGRPSKRYVATAPAVAIDSGGVRRDELVLALLGRALELLPREQAEAMAEEVGVEYGQRMAASLAGGDAHRSFRAALGAVADALTAHGFAAHTEARGDVVSIVAEHCPFGGASVVSPVVCALDRGMVKG
ncbi:MAG TPA: helix-turn-helix domain-containing protein, partial [Acidimicrobiales bacterium]|nr:helix-turn-helix domain-containing protein [Acidimicrobiales bacterium]